MAGFEPTSSGFGTDRAAKCATPQPTMKIVEPKLTSVDAVRRKKSFVSNRTVCFYARILGPRLGCCCCCCQGNHYPQMLTDSSFDHLDDKGEEKGRQTDRERTAEGKDRERKKKLQFNNMRLGRDVQSKMQKYLKKTDRTIDT